MSRIYRTDARGHGTLAEWTGVWGRARAQKVFEEHAAQGFAMFRLDPGKETLLDTFDPDAQDVLAVPRLVGG